jgi:hypothetical protein
MDNRPASTSALIVALMGILAISLPLSRQGGAQSAARSLPGQSELISEGDHGFAGHSAPEMVLEAIDRDPDQFPSTDAEGKQFPWRTDFSKTPCSICYKVQFLIATVPQPSTPALRFSFDSTVDSIQKAAYHAGFVIEKSYLPWKRPDTAASGIKLADTIEASVDIPGTVHLKIADKSSDRSHADPGIVLFRNDREPGPDADGNKDGNAQSFLIVFLVGETPTTGVDKQQLMNALEQEAFMAGYPSTPGTEQLRRVLPSVAVPSKNQVRILGPSYSGSAFSLEVVLNTWLAANSIAAWASEASPNKAQKCDPAHRFVRIVSGGASSIDLDRQFKDPRMSFQATVVPDVFIKKQIDAYIKKAHGQFGELAILTEADTSYGRKAARGLPEAKYKDRPLRLTFPLHISQLRTRFDTVGAGQSIPSLTRRNVALPDEGETHEDVVVEFSPRSVVYWDLVLDGMMQTLKREGIKFVYIVATDTDDLVFLAQQIRRNVPRVTLIASGDNLIFLHSDFNPDLQGMLLFSTYPLFGSVQSRLDDESREFLQFPTSGAEGVYNAGVALLEGKGLVDYGIAFAPSDSSAQPGLWTSMVGSNSLWPLDVTPADPATTSQYMVQDPSSNRRTGTARPVSYPFSFLWLFYAVSIGAVFVAASLLMVYPFGRSRPTWQFRVAFPGILGPALTERRRYNRAVCHLALLLMIITAYVLLVAVGTRVLVPAQFDVPWAQRISHMYGQSTRWSWVIVPVVIGLLCLATTGVVRELLRGWPGRRRTAINCGWFPLLVAGVSLLCALTFFVTMFSDPAGSTRRDFFLATRMIDLGGGASPLLAISYVGIAMLAPLLGDLRRMHLLEVCSLPQPFLVRRSVAPSLAEVEELEAEVWMPIGHRGFRLPAFAWAMLFLTGFIGGHLLYEAMRSGPPGTEFLAYITAIISLMVYAMLFAMIVRFATGWWALRRLLRRLYWHPSRSAYAKLRATTTPKAIETQQSIRLLEAQPSFTAVEYCLEQARTLVRLLGRPCFPPWIEDREASREALTAGIISVEKALESTLQQENPDGFVHFRAFSQQILSRLSNEVCRLMEGFWRVRSPNSLALRKPSESAIVDAGELFVAGRVVELLRQIFPQLISLASFAIVGVVALTLAAASYPFSDRDAIMLMSWIVLLSTIVLLATVFMQVGRDRVVSFLQGTAPGHVTFNADFLVRMALFVVLPILTLLGAQFPHVFGQFVSWFGAHPGPGSR